MMQVLPSPLETSAGEGPARTQGFPPELSGIQSLFAQAYSMIGGMLDRLRESQSVLQDTAVQKLQDTNAKLHAVTSATESAASDIMDGLDRALALIDRLETGGEAADAVTPELRDEIFGVMNHLQFQDITTQQLQYAASLLRDMEAQLVQFKQVLEPATHGPAPPPTPARHDAPPTFDPAATTLEAEQRQALVDQLLGG